MIGSAGTGGMCRVVAAIEHAHGGDRAVVARLLGEVRDSGADAVKLSVRSDRALDRLAAHIDWFVAEAHGLEIVLAPYDLDAMQQLSQLAVTAWKIDPPLITHLPLLEAVAADGRPVLAGIAGCTKRELDEAVSRLPESAILVHTLMPETGANDVVDVAHMTALRQYGRQVGYADARVDVDGALIAVALGARVVEKRLALDRPSQVADRPASLLLHEFRSFVGRVRRLEGVLASDGTRDPLPEELDAIDAHRVSIVAATAISRGVPIRREMLAFQPHAAGLSPRFVQVVEGRRALYDIPEGALVTFGVIEA